MLLTVGEPFDTEATNALTRANFASFASLG